MGRASKRYHGLSGKGSAISCTERELAKTEGSRARDVVVIWFATYDVQTHEV